MGAPATLQNHMAQTPWPGNADHVIFLLDADRAFERHVLKEWISRHAADTPRITVCVALRDDRKTLAVDELVRALEQQPEASLRHSGYLGCNASEPTKQVRGRSICSAGATAGHHVSLPDASPSNNLSALTLPLESPVPGRRWQSASPQKPVLLHRTTSRISRFSLPGRRRSCWTWLSAS